MIVAADLAPVGTGDARHDPGLDHLRRLAVRSPASRSTFRAATPAPRVRRATIPSATLRREPARSRCRRLPAGCTAPAPRSVAVALGRCHHLELRRWIARACPVSISGVVRRSNDNSVLAGVTVVASGGGSAATDAAGAYSIAGVPSGSGTLSVSGAPAECSAVSEPYTLPSGGSITENITVSCTAPPQPGYAYSATWSSLREQRVRARAPHRHENLQPRRHRRCHEQRCHRRSSDLSARAIPVRYNEAGLRSSAVR